MGLFKKNGNQRMGQGYNSCINLNNWAHLFNPNSESAQQGALNCFDHWNRVAPAPGQGYSIETTRSGLDERVQPIGDGFIIRSTKTAFTCPPYCPTDSIEKGSSAVAPKMLSQRTVPGTTVEKEATMQMVKFFLVVGAIAFIIYKFGK